jgi:hypothetical protein
MAIEKEINPIVPHAGRPTEYKPEYCQKIVELMANGCSEYEVAWNFKVCYKTLTRWATQHPEFKESFDLAKTARLARLTKIMRERLEAGVPINIPGFALILNKEHPDAYPESGNNNLTVNFKEALSKEEVDKKLKLLLENRNKELV